MKKLLLISFVLLAGCEEKVAPTPTPEQAKLACGVNGLKEYKVELIRHSNQISFTCHTPEDGKVISEVKGAAFRHMDANMVF